MSDSQLGLAEFNALPSDDAESLLASCCGSRSWVREMNARRPFASLPALFDLADRTWWKLLARDWREAFDHHPRIGDTRASGPASTQSAAWSSSEQSAAAASTADERDALLRAQADYEARFGFIFLVCASGRSSAELLTNLQERMRNSTEEELRVAAGEQSRITALRLQRLFG